MIVKKLTAFNWGKHTELDFDCDGSIVGVLGKNGCLSGDTEIIVRRNKGSVKYKLSELVARLRGEKFKGDHGLDLNCSVCVQCDVGGFVRQMEISQAYYSGIKGTFEVRTVDGRSVRATGEHRFKTPNGWVELKNLVPGDKLMVNGGRSERRRHRKNIYPRIGGLVGHPFALRKTHKTAKFICPKHRLVVEAELNNISLDEFVNRLRSGDVAGLTFLNTNLWHVHHKDHNTKNFDRSNLQIMSVEDHLRLHGQDCWKNASEVVVETAVASITAHGMEPTYDITMMAEPRNFLANGFVVHNSGKSTVLALLEFLITGTTRDNHESYVKDFTGSGGGEMVFQKYGKTGTIMRQVGNTAKRRLEWDGKVYTKAAEVDKVMTELFGADKKALANSVFVNQGTLEDVLFRAGADRRHAFIELVNLSYCATRASQVDVQIKKIGAGIVDLTPARDEAILAKNTAEATLVKIDTDIGTMLDYSGWLGLLRARSTSVSNLNLLQQQLGDLQTKLTLKTEEFASRASGLTLDDHKAYLAEQENEFSKLQDEVGAYRSIHTELARYRTLQESINTARTTLARWVTQLSTLNPEGLTVAGLNERLQALQATIQGHDKYVGLTERIETGAVELDRLMTEKGQLVTPPTDAEVKAVEAELIKNRNHVALLKRYEQMQTEISGCMGTSCPDKAECPKCGLTLANTFELSADELAEKNRLLMALNQTVTQLDQELTSKRTALWKHTSETKRLTQMIDAQQRSHNQLIAERTKLSAFADVGNAVDEVSVAMVLRDKIIEVTGERDKAKTTLSTLLQEQNKYPLAKEHWANRDQFTSAKLQELLSALEVRKTGLQADRQTVSLLISADGQIENIKLELNQKQTALDEANATVNADLPEGLPPEGKTLEQFEMEMTASEQVRTGLNASRVTAASNYQDCNARYQDILTRMEENQVKVDLLRDLTTLKGMLSDDGLPLAYVKHRFEQLTVHTQDALAKMNADFYVGADPEKPLEFSFHRLDTPTSVEMPMNKLSGGQRVRLCISFLMALQKVLIKDVGLLVLDEPLVHTDENGIDQIVAFLSDMRQELKNAEHQIWVVDHNPKISSALDKRLQLN